MSDLLSGLEQFGLGNLKNMNLYDEPAKKTDENGGKAAAAAPVMQERIWICGRNMTRSIC